MSEFINFSSEHSVPVHVFSVSELTSTIKNLLEEKFAFIWITGEISNFSKPSSGHYYFTLKDPKAQINTVMFRGQNRRLAFLPENGMQITALGRISVYEPRGTYQLIVEHLEPKGIGALQMAFEQLKEKLRKEGLFDEKHKRPIPLFPHKICVITSPTGAVVHDIINVATRRFPNIDMTIIPVSVQGADAERDIVDAVNLVNARKDFDLAIIARGGGSLEDLQAFNSENVARAVFSSGIPIVSAIGHETDFTIVDFLSDLRAPTPSAAAELVVPDKAELLALVDSRRKMLFSLFQGHLEKKRHLFLRAAARLIHPRQKVQDYRLRIDDLLNRMDRFFSYRNQSFYDRLEFVRKRLYSSLLTDKVQKNRAILEQINDNILKNLFIILKQKRFDLQELSGKLYALSPISILERGYSITRTITEKQIVKDADSVFTGQKLELILARGMLNCIVEGKKTHVEEDI